MVTNNRACVHVDRRQEDGGSTLRATDLAG